MRTKKGRKRKIEENANKNNGDVSRRIALFSIISSIGEIIDRKNFTKIVII